jgi:uncharacterized membrane protein YidH (DUF202 family)
MNKNTSQPSGPALDNWHFVRAEIANQHTRSMLIINGGAAIALLAFLKEVWATDVHLAQLIIFSLLVFSSGVACAGISNWLRYETSLRYQTEAPSRHHWSLASNIIQVLAVLCFVIGSFTLGLGAMRLLN